MVESRSLTANNAISYEYFGGPVGLACFVLTSHFTIDITITVTMGCPRGTTTTTTTAPNILPSFRRQIPPSDSSLTILVTAVHLSLRPHVYC